MKNKKIKEFGLPKMYIVKSTRDGDLRAEVIGRGEDFYNTINVKKLQEMAISDDYVENFGYSFN